MRNLRSMSGQVMAVAASLLLVTACGGSDDPAVDPTATTTTTTSADTTTTSTGETTTTSATTTTTTLAPQLNLAAATVVAQHSQLCLATINGTAGSKVTQIDCATAGAAQSWKISPTGETYTFLNNGSNLCLGVPDAEPESFAVQMTCDGSLNVQWKLQPVVANPGEFNLVPALSPTQCLDVFGNEQAPGADVIQFDCVPPEQANKRWVITAIAS